MQQNVRANERIRAREVRVIDEDGSQVGILPIRDALNLARERELDLVEIAPTAQPPVCRIMNLGKFMYEASKKAQKARKKQKTIQVKEVKFRPKIDEHDYQFKKKHIERFMEDGHKVKAVIMFRGRELAHPEIGRRILERLMEELKDIIDIERPPRQEGNNMIAIFTAKRT
ncbi:MAG TPA: translation initiation factor IF-3 [Acidobacteriota bacterium]|nr:translation initiation factor IF-3 [Acidobacteriota bacterium]